jgi:hypothetical protein
MDSAEDALADALTGHQADRLRGLARQLREVAGALERAGSCPGVPEVRRVSSRRVSLRLINRQLIGSDAEH